MLEDAPWLDNEIVRRQRLREQARRPLEANLEEAFELSEFAFELSQSLRKSSWTSHHGIASC